MINHHLREAGNFLQVLEALPHPNPKHCIQTKESVMLWFLEQHLYTMIGGQKTQLEKLKHSLVQFYTGNLRCYSHLYISVLMEIFGSPTFGPQRLFEKTSLDLVYLDVKLKLSQGFFVPCLKICHNSWLSPRFFAESDYGMSFLNSIIGCTSHWQMLNPPLSASLHKPSIWKQKMHNISGSNGCGISKEQLAKFSPTA